VKPADGEARLDMAPVLPGIGGSFWVSNISAGDKPLVRAMASGPLGGTATMSAASTGDIMAPTANAKVFVENRDVDFSAATVFRVDGDNLDQLRELHGDPDGWLGFFRTPGDPWHPAWGTLYDDFGVLQCDFGELLLWAGDSDTPGIPLAPEDTNAYWACLTRQGFECARIRRPDGTWMLRGIDFQSGEGLVLFQEDPFAAFPTRRFTANGWDNPGCPFHFVWGLDDIRSSGYWVSYYFRRGQSALSFKRALAEASGLAVCSALSYVSHVEVLGVGAVYHTDRERLVAAYPHTLLGVGHPLVAGDIIADAEDYTVDVVDGELHITLSTRLFTGAFLRRAMAFIAEERPLGVPFTIDTPEIT